MDFSNDDLAWFEQLYDVVMEANARMNLTRITDREEFFAKHIVDSALPFFIVPALVDLPETLRAADLGSGAGFPGLVLARLKPDWNVALIERTQKKARYLNEACKRLELKNVHVVAKDAKEAGIAKCNLIVARAVGPLAKVVRAAAPLLKRRGLLVHYKGGGLQENEIAEGFRAGRKLGLIQDDPVGYQIPPRGDARTLVISRSIGQRRGAAHRGS